MILYALITICEVTMRYFVGFLITIGLLILLIMLLFRGGDDKPKISTATKPLADYASTAAEASLTADGPVNAASEHSQEIITVGRDQVVFEQLRGYDGDVISTKRYDNTENAYKNFLLALSNAGFTKGDRSTALREERGYCPTGNRYIMEFNNEGKNLLRYWATSCGKPKTYLGDLSLTLTLFRAQVPDYVSLTQSNGL